MSPKNIIRQIEGNIVLPEVVHRLRDTGEPVNVICSLYESSSVDEVREFLEGNKLKVTVSGHTDYYVFATIENMDQVNLINLTKVKPELKVKGKKGTKKKPVKKKKENQRVIGHVWLDKKLMSCVRDSKKTINVLAATHLFKAYGKDIGWVVMDSGVDINHKWFTRNGNFDKGGQEDFTGESDAGYSDPHGTHVAGIIAGLAYDVTLWDFKVLGKDGGSSSMLIRAMERVRKINDQAGEMKIHGVNISLGGPVPIPSYACGWSPECQEANRLMNSGVLVCIAAGNDGYKAVATVVGGDLDIFSTYIDMGITDPGNAEEVITVGSCHKDHPHSYGPSFFSSKGPTGDGRFKPDCLAPGENIVSAEAGTSDGTIEMDGTSMATPHVSGALVVFLSAKPEFKGKAREVKKFLLNTCTDLNRDRNFQGSGLVDVLRMIQSV